jgi:tight adherence protein B
MINNPLMLIAIILLISLIGLLVFLSYRNHKKQQHDALLRAVVDTAQNRLLQKNTAQHNHVSNVVGKLRASNTTNTLPLRLQQAGFAPTSAKSFYMWSVVTGVVVLLLAKLFGYGLLPTVLLVFTATFGLPRWFLGRKARRRQKQFLEDMPEALDAMVRLLKAGMPVIEAINMVGHEFKGPIAEEMLAIYEAQKVGISLPDATHRSAKRMPISEMHMLATALEIQTETGSSLSEVLTNLSQLIRGRFRLKRKIQALSAEAKASASIIGALPVLVGGALYLINPTYMAPMFTEGTHMLYGSGFWMFCGIMVMRQMINFRI